MISEKKRVDWIDIAKGIAILCVIIGHSLGSYWPNFLAEIIFIFHMPVFFVLSGYLYRTKNNLYLAKNNMVNLLVPYGTTVLIEAIVIVVCRIMPNNILYSRIDSVKQLIASGIYGNGVANNFFGFQFMAIGAVWFLLAMFFGSIIFNSVMKLEFKQHDLMFKGIISILFTTISIILSVKISLPFSLIPAFGSQVFLFLGYVIKKNKIIQNIKLPTIIILILVWIFTAKIGIFGMVSMSSPNTYLSVVGGMAASIVVMKVSMYIDNFFRINILSWFKKVLIFFGNNSLLILCFHLIDLDSVNIWPIIIEKVSIYMPYQFAIIIGIIYRILFVVVATLVIRKIPVIRNLYMNRMYPIKNIFKFFN